MNRKSKYPVVKMVYISTYKEFVDEADESHASNVFRLAPGTIIDGRDLGGAEFSTSLIITVKVNPDLRITKVPLDKEITLSVPVRGDDGLVVTDEAGKWVTESMKVDPKVLKDAIEHERRTRRAAAQTQPMEVAESHAVPSTNKERYMNPSSEVSEISVPYSEDVAAAALRIARTYSDRAKVATALRTAGYEPSKENVDGVFMALMGNTETEALPDVIKSIPSIADVAGLKKILSPEATEMLTRLRDGQDYYNILDGRTIRSSLASDEPYEGYYGRVLYGAVLPLKYAYPIASRPGVESFEDICDAATGHYFNIWSVVDEYKPDEVASLVKSVINEPGWVIGTKDNVLAAGVAQGLSNGAERPVPSTADTLAALDKAAARNKATSTQAGNVIKSDQRHVR